MSVAFSKDMSLLTRFSIALVFVSLTACLPEATDISDLPIVDERCSIENLNGECSGNRVCANGACIVDLDPGGALSVDKQALWSEIWNYYDINYGAFLAKPNLDWDIVFEDTEAALENANTDFEVNDTIARAIEKIGDGHTALYADALCSADPGFGSGFSNVGACLIEGEEGLLVYKHLPNANFEMGDLLLSIDGRSPELLLNDAIEQPRCARASSSDAQLRQTMVASLLFRDAADSKARVLRGGEEVEIELEQSQALLCDGRLLDDEREILGNGVETKVLEGDVLYVRLDVFGSRVNGEFVDQPVIDTLRGVFEGARERAGIVFDLRANPGGFVTVYSTMASWFLQQSRTPFFCQSKNGPAHDDLTPRGGGPITPDAELQITAPLAILIDGRSFSASDFMSYFMQAFGRSQNFGLPSGGGFGGGGGESVSGVYAANNPILCSTPEGEYLEGNSPAVDEVVLHSVSALRANVDSVLEAGRRYVARE